jgi:transcriptional regulator with XRE-family HTH domain
MASTGDRLRAARELRRLSQAELAELIGVSRTTIVNWETDLHPPRHLARLREELDLDEHLLPRKSPEATNYADMDDHELTKRMTLLVSQLSAVAAEVTHRLLARDNPSSDRARPAPGAGRYVMDLEDTAGYDEPAAEHRAGGAAGAL